MDEEAYRKLSESERDLVFTAHCIRQGIDKEYNVTLDPNKGTCRLGERKVGGVFTRCMMQYDGERCPLKDKFRINVTQVSPSDFGHLRNNKSSGVPDGLVSSACLIEAENSDGLLDAPELAAPISASPSEPASNAAAARVDWDSTCRRYCHCC